PGVSEAVPSAAPGTGRLDSTAPEGRQRLRKNAIDFSGTSAPPARSPWFDTYLGLRVASFRLPQATRLRTFGAKAQIKGVLAVRQRPLVFFTISTVPKQKGTCVDTQVPYS